VNGSKHVSSFKALVILLTLFILSTGGDKTCRIIFMSLKVPCGKIFAFLPLTYRGFIVETTDALKLVIIM
jgi:hypothetical protein